MNKLPSNPVQNMEKLENTLLESLGKDSISRFQIYKDAVLEEQ